MKKLLTIASLLAVGAVLFSACDWLKEKAEEELKSAACDENVVSATITGSTWSEDPEKSKTFEGCQSYIWLEEKDMLGQKVQMLTISMMQISTSGNRNILITLMPFSKDTPGTMNVDLPLYSKFGACEQGDSTCNHKCEERVGVDPECEQCPQTAGERDDVCIHDCPSVSPVDDPTGYLAQLDADCGEALLPATCDPPCSEEEGEKCVANPDPNQENGVCEADPAFVQVIGQYTEDTTVSKVMEAYGTVKITAFDASNPDAVKVKGSFDITFWMDEDYSDSQRVKAKGSFDITDDAASDGF